MNTESKSETPEGQNQLGLINQIELQLHEQYAMNNNANVSSIITFIVGIVAVLGAFGTVYIEIEPGKYSEEDLFFVGTWCIFVLGVIAFVCIEVGARQRFEQFITHAIRFNSYKHYWPDNARFYFPNKYVVYYFTYHPFGKKCSNFIQGIFNIFWIVCSIIAFLIFLIYFTTEDKDNCLWGIIYRFSFFAYFFVIAIQILCKFRKYNKLQKEYFVYNPLYDNKLKYDYNDEDKDKEKVLSFNKDTEEINDRQHNKDYSFAELAKMMCNKVREFICPSFSVKNA